MDADSLQPELKVCAVSLRPSKTVAAPPSITDDEQLYLAGFFAALSGDVVGVPVLPEAVPVAGPWVLWASQTGNAEELAARLVDQLGAAGLVAKLINMNDCTVSDLAARDVLVVTSTFGDGDAPDNGAGFWERLQAPDVPELHGLRFAVLGIGDRSYGQFCGHARSLDSRLAELGGARLLDRSDCEAHDEDS